MPLSQDNFIQTNTGTFEGTSGTASLPVGATAGNALIIAVAIDGDGSTTFDVSDPSGFVQASTNASGLRRGKVFLFLKQTAAGGETSFTITITGGSVQACWAVFEAEGLDLSETYLGGEAQGLFLNGGTNPAGDSTLVSSRIAGPTNTSDSYDTLSIALFEATSSDTTVPVLSGHTNGFQELVTLNRANATRAMAMSLAIKPSMSLEAFSSTVSVSPSSYTFSTLITFTALTAKHAVAIDTCSGFEIGTTTGLTVVAAPDASPPPFDASAGTPAIVTSTPKTGNYCLELSASAAIEYVAWTTNSNKGNLDREAGTAPALGVCRFAFRCPTSLPAGDVVIASVEAGSAANGVVIRYVSASQKIGVKVGSGTEVLSNAAIAADKWIGFDFYYDPRTTSHTCDWQVDYDTSEETLPVTQTRATNTGMTAATISGVFFGWKAASTATIRYDDMVWSRSRKAYPIGDVNIRPLKVDPAGTLTISGTSTNFKVFTSNGTMSTWDATNARAAIDDIPPTIGASSDGIAQVTAASSDYVEIPMETYTAAPMNSHRGARWYWAPWAASTNQAFQRVDMIDGAGASSTIGYGPGDGNFDDVNLIWVSRMHRTGLVSTGYYLLDQAKVDGFACRWGFSSDATPDVGLHSVLVELVTQPAIVYGVLGVENDSFRVYVRQDPVSQSAVSYLVTTPSGSRGATFNATINGSPFSQYVGPNTTYEKVIGAVDISEVTYIDLSPDPA